MTQSPVNLNAFTHILGFLGSPENLTENAFDIESHNGSFSQVSSIDVYPVVAQVIQSIHSSHVSQSGQGCSQGGTTSQ